MQSSYSHDSQSKGSAGYTLQPTPTGAIKITKVVVYKGVTTFFLAMGNLGLESSVYQSGKPVLP